MAKRERESRRDPYKHTHIQTQIKADSPGGDRMLRLLHDDGHVDDDRGRSGGRRTARRRRREHLGRLVDVRPEAVVRRDQRDQLVRLQLQHHPGDLVGQVL